MNVLKVSPLEQSLEGTLVASSPRNITHIER